MSRIKCCSISVILFSVGCILHSQTEAQTLLKVCGNPSAPCQSKHKEFAPFEISLTLPARVKANQSYKSEAFFAVILQDRIAVPGDEECDGGEFHTRVESERKRVQSMFPNHKAFASHQCPDMGALGYAVDGQPYNEIFLAVYGGTTLEVANGILQSARTKYPAAVIKKMQAVFEHILQ
jgi:hypothetical protein